MCKNKVSGQRGSFPRKGEEKHLLRQKKFLLNWRPVLLGFSSCEDQLIAHYPKDGVRSIDHDISFANQLRNGFPVIKIACMRSWVFSIPQRLRNASRSRSSTCCSVIGVMGEQSPPVRTRAR